MRVLISSTILCLFFAGNYHIGDEIRSSEKHTLSICPDENYDNRELLKDFLTKAEWSDERDETNTNGLDISTISVLEDSNYSGLCNSFNNTYPEILSQEISSGQKLYNETYYKVGSFYFVIITLNNDSTTIVASGLEFIDVFDQNANRIQGYAF